VRDYLSRYGISIHFLQSPDVTFSIALEQPAFSASAHVSSDFGANLQPADNRYSIDSR